MSPSQIDISDIVTEGTFRLIEDGFIVHPKKEPISTKSEKAKAFYAIHNEKVMEFVNAARCPTQ